MSLFHRQSFNFSAALIGVSILVITEAGCDVQRGSEPQRVQTGDAVKTEFEVILESCGENKIQVIKIVRAATGLGLKDAKDLVESAPCKIKGGLSKENAEQLKKELEEVGAKAVIK